MSTLKVNAISNVAGTGSPNITEQAKAWVNFNGTGTVAIRGDFNVSSITDSGTGAYSANFTNAFVDLNYVTVGQAWFAGVTGALFAIEGVPTSTTSKVFGTANPGATGAIDTNHITIAFFR
jgi:hypothetical protein